MSFYYTYLIDFWPHCTTCEAHQTGFPPNCEWLPCPVGWRTKTGMCLESSEILHRYLFNTYSIIIIGFFPDCYAPPSCHELGNCPATCPPYSK